MRPFDNLLNFALLRAPEAGAGAGEGGDKGDAVPGSLADAAAAATAEGQAAADADAAAKAANGGYRPQGLPDHLFGDSDQGTIDNLHKAFNGYRDDASTRGAVPEKADGYKFDASEKLQPYVDNLAEDELYQGIAQEFHKAGITDKQFAAVMPAILEQLLDAGDVGAPVDFNAMVTELVPQDAKGLDPAGQKAAAGKRIDEALTFLDGMKGQGGFDLNPEKSTEIADYVVAQLGDDPKGIQAIEAFRALGGKVSPALGGNSDAGLSDAALDGRLNDPRGDPRHLKFDKAFAAETDRMFKERYPNKSGGV